jgi:hypothetical protein
MKHDRSALLWANHRWERHKRGCAEVSNVEPALGEHSEDSTSLDLQNLRGSRILAYFRVEEVRNARALMK